MHDIWNTYIYYLDNVIIDVVNRFRHPTILQGKILTIAKVAIGKQSIICNSLEKVFIQDFIYIKDIKKRINHTSINGSMIKYPIGIMEKAGFGTEL